MAKLDEQTRRNMRIVHESFRVINREKEQGNTDRLYAYLEKVHNLLPVRYVVIATNSHVYSRIYQCESLSKVALPTTATTTTSTDATVVTTTTTTTPDANKNVYIIGNLSGTPHTNHGKRFGLRDMIR